MQVLRKLTYNPNLAISLGYFDGVHLGHQSVIKSAVDYARENSKKSAVITFENHPCCYFYGVCPKYILSREDRIKYIEDLGVDYLYLLDFEKISSLTGEEYLKDILYKYFKPISISTGFNHSFGAKKSGGTDLLEKMQSELCYKYFKLEPYKCNNEIISSTNIRNLLNRGDIELANSMLGRKFSISGVVIEGNKIGRTIGFRTANLKYPPERIDIPFGVYSVDILYNNLSYKGIANFGVKPTIKGSNSPVLEVHILDFEKEIYGENLQVDFNRMIRKEKKFLSLNDLKMQISNDIINLIV